ncbi:calcium-binding protein, partial [Roseibium sp. RKSG952]|uniref:calcium-binding protein n=1 Tax=Roseibium sp. RKSG952 TaxID=2529384 RepID=UPI0012BD48C7
MATETINGTSGNDTIDDTRTIGSGIVGLDWYYLFLNGDEQYREVSPVTDVEFYGGNGNDTVDLDWFNYIFYGGSGDDTAIGSGTFYGGDGDDTKDGNGDFDGGDGNDTMTGYGTFTGGAGDDTFYVEDGKGVFYGGSGDNFFFANNGDKNDTVETEDGDDTIYTGKGNDTIIAGAGDDFVDPGDINSGDSDTVTLGDGNDILYLGDIGSSDASESTADYWATWATAKAGSTSLDVSKSLFKLAADSLLSTNPIAGLVLDTVTSLGSAALYSALSGAATSSNARVGDQSSTVELTDYDPRYDMVILPTVSVDDPIPLDGNAANGTFEYWLDADNGGEFLEASFDEDYYDDFITAAGLSGATVNKATVFESIHQAIWDSRVSFSKNNNGDISISQGDTVLDDTTFGDLYDTVDSALNNGEALSIMGNFAGYNFIADDDHRFVSGSSYSDVIRTDSTNTTGGSSYYMALWEGDDTVVVNSDRDDLYYNGGEGTDTISFTGLNSGISVDLGDTGQQNVRNELDITLVDVENAIGTTANDTITGSDVRNMITGGGGTDDIDAAGGDDIIFIQQGDSSTIDGGDGTDRIVVDLSDSDSRFDGGFGSSSSYFSGTATNIEGYGLVLSDNNDNVNGITGGDDIAFGAGGNDWIKGADGADELYGEDGNDTLLGHWWNSGGDDADSLYGGNGDDALYGDYRYGTGTGGNDFLDGGAGNDTIVAGGGNDTIIAGDGDDTLTGNDGDDRFEFDTDDGTNIITDFEVSDTFNTIAFEGDVSVTATYDGEDTTLAAGDTTVILTDFEFDFDYGSVSSYFYYRSDSGMTVYDGGKKDNGETVICTYMHEIGVIP